MVDARAIDVHNALATRRCEVMPCSCFFPGNECKIEHDDTCGYSNGCGSGLNRGFGWAGSTETPPPAQCCTVNYAQQKLQGSKPVAQVLDAAEKNDNYLLVPINVSKNHVHQLYDRPQLDRFVAQRELHLDGYAIVDEESAIGSNLFWRDGYCDQRTSTSEHLTASFKAIRQKESNHLNSLLDKYVPR